MPLGEIAANFHLPFKFFVPGLGRKATILPFRNIQRLTFLHLELFQNFLGQDDSDGITNPVNFRVPVHARYNGCHKIKAQPQI